MTHFISRRAALGLLGGVLGGLHAVPALAADKIKVVASFSILADLVRQVGGERVRVVSIVGADGDAHVFEPSPTHVRMVQDAHVVVVNGISFERWAEGLVRNAGFKGVRCVASKGIRAISHGGGVDPHAWQDPANVKLYVENIAAALGEADPANAGAYVANARRYSARLDGLDREIRQSLASIPRERRKVITSHDAFTYFGDAYDVDFLAPQGTSTHADASAAQLGSLIRQIRSEGIKAVFIENMTGKGAVQQIARETGVKIGGTLYADALPSSGGYIEMMRHNARLISAAMR